MADLLGNITIADVVAAGVFPLIVAYPLVEEKPLEIVTHAFRNEAANLKIEQRFLLGTGARRWALSIPEMTLSQRDTLLTFWRARQGSYQPFTWNKPTDDRSGTEAVTVHFAGEPLVFDAVSQMVSAQVTLVEVPTVFPTYSVTATQTRFPSGSLPAALLSQVQEVIPLVKILPRQAGYPAIYISDRRCTVGGQLYLARLQRWDGITQTMNGESDQARFILGNADRAVTSLVNDPVNGTDLWRATVEFSLFHVGTGIKLDIWKGYVSDWQMDEGPEFALDCSDGLYDLNLMYPPDVIDRVCWKQRQGLYNDGVNCPFSSAGALDLVHFGGTASAGSCDGGYETPNGCLAHGMKRYFGGILAEPQGVSIKDNSTGHWGYGRSPLTATSIVADSIYGQVLPRIFTDRQFPVNCKIVAGRDESDFYDALMIVGKGPLGSYGTGHTLDGSYHHGYPGLLGLRGAMGTDPAGASDFFSLGQSGDQTGGDWRKVFSGASTYKDNFAAGVAFLELRRSDEKGLQLTRPSDHAGVAQVWEGLSGWIWTAPGARGTGVLVNPVWIALDAVLDVLRLKSAAAGTAEQFFVPADAIASAAICEQVVAKLIGAGTEYQYHFAGIIQEQKPLRAWLSEILMTCLGYYTFDFGRVSFGLRANASAVESFTTGNILDGTVRLERLHPEFNELTASFADAEYQFQPNTVAVPAVDHIKYFGQRQTSQLNLVGVIDKSHAGRLAAIRLREELGGIDLAEWRAARNISFGTTILALAVKPGMVCSLTHPDMPGGVGKFRVSRVVWNGDYSVQIEGRTVTDSMYNLVTGPKPVDVVAAPVPVERITYPLKSPWWAATKNAAVGDPLYSPNLLTFRLTEYHETIADSSVASYLVLRGANSVNSFLDVPIPVIAGIGYATSGGFLPSGRDYFVSVVPYIGSGFGPVENIQFGPPSNTLAIHIPAGGSSNRITIASITWPQAPSGQSWGGYAVLAGLTERTMAIYSVGDVGAVLPATISITATNAVGNRSVQPNFSHVAGLAKLIVNNGIVHADVTGVTSTTITVSDFAGGGDAFAGRRLSILAGPEDNREAPLLNFACSAYNQLTGTFTVTPSPTGVNVQVGQRLIVRVTPVVSGNTISDSAWSLPDVKGHVVRILAGTGSGQARTIGANTSTSVTVDEPWDVQPDATSLVVIEEPDWSWSAVSGQAPNSRFREIDIDIPVDNHRGVFMLAAGFGVDRAGGFSLESETLMREIYFRGQQFEVSVVVDTTATENDRIFLVNATTGTRNIALAPAAETKGQVITIKRAAGGNAITFSGDASGAVSDAVQLYSDGSTYEVIGGAAASGGSTGLIGVHAVTLNAGVLTISSPPGMAPDVAGRIFLLVVTQGSPGGHVPTWSVHYDSANLPEILGGDGEVTRVMFVSESDSKWHLVSGPY